MVMEKSWNVKNLPKVMELCESVMEFDRQNRAKFVFFLSPPRNKQRSYWSRKAAFSDVFRKMSQMQNQGERWSWKIKKWSWKIHGKIFCQVCGNPDYSDLG